MKGHIQYSIETSHAGTHLAFNRDYPVLMEGHIQYSIETSHAGTHLAFNTGRDYSWSDTSSIQERLLMQGHFQ